MVADKQVNLAQYKRAFYFLLFFSEVDQVLEEVTQRGERISILGGIQN